VLLAAFLLMAVYDLWGKHMAFPLTTDFVQGAAWALFALCGAALGPGGPSRLTGVVLLYVVVFIMLTNGIHGSLRDLDNDLSAHARTTAILLGARPAAMGVVLPQRLMLYALGLQTALASIVLLPLLGNWFGYSATTQRALLVLVLALLALSYAFWPALPRLLEWQPRFLLVGIVHVSVQLWVLVALFFPALETGLRAVFVLVFLLPILTSRRYPDNPFASAQRQSERSAQVSA
jgi:hypothetical protein